MEQQDEYEAAYNVNGVEEDGYPHGEFGILHAYEPAFDGIEPQGGRGSPYTDEEVGEGELHDGGAVLDLEDEQRQTADGPL